jgi:hypothetical protein
VRGGAEDRQEAGAEASGGEEDSGQGSESPMGAMGKDFEKNRSEVKRKSEVVMNPLAGGTGHLTRGGAICNRQYRHTCQYCGCDVFNTVPFTKSCLKRECIKKRDADTAARKKRYQQEMAAKKKREKLAEVLRRAG